MLVSVMHEGALDQCRNRHLAQVYTQRFTLGRAAGHGMKQSHRFLLIVFVFDIIGSLFSYTCPYVHLTTRNAERTQSNLVAEQVSSSGGSVSAGAPALGTLPFQWYTTAIYYI